jgi:hypothetical protein
MICNSVRGFVKKNNSNGSNNKKKRRVHLEQVPRIVRETSSAPPDCEPLKQNLKKYRNKIKTNL